MKSAAVQSTHDGSRHIVTPDVEGETKADHGGGLGPILDDVEFDLTTDGAAPIPLPDDTAVPDPPLPPPLPPPSDYASKGLEAKSKFHCLDHGTFIS